MVHNESTNTLVHYRKRMRLTQFQVARLLGWKNTKGLCRIEGGQVRPTLMTAFKLGVIYRVPLEFLYAALYQEIRQDIRAREAMLTPAGQKALPLTYANAEHP